MRHYDLDTNGKVKGSYAVPQPGKELILLEDAPDDESKRDGVPGTVWIPDTDIIDARLAEEAAIAAKHQALIDNLPSWQQVSDAIDSATTIAALKVIVKKIARVVYWIAKNKEE
jgi:hypothetical protein